MFPEWMGEYPRVNVLWTDAECEVLRESLNNGESLKNIANKHGRTIGGIESKILDLFGKNYWETKKKEKVNPIHELIKQGYCRISNKYNMISRIDDPNWVKILADKLNLALADFYKPNGQISSQWADHYRRCISKDRLIVDKEIYQHIPNSNNNTTGYLEKCK